MQGLILNYKTIIYQDQTKYDFTSLNHFLKYQRKYACQGNFLLLESGGKWTFIANHHQSASHKEQ